MTKRIVMCTFPGSSQEYAYFTNDDSIQVDDLVIVISPNSGSYHDHGWRQHVPELGGYPTIVKVTSTDETVHGIMKATKEIVQKIDLSAAIAAAAHAKAVDALKAKIARAKKEALEHIELAKLADFSPELGDLVKELATLTGITIEKKPIPVRAHRRRATSKGSTSVRSKSIAKQRRTAKKK